MLEFVMPLDDAETDFNALPDFVQGYFEAMFFTNTGSGDDAELEHATFADVSQTLRVSSIADCELFQQQAQALLTRAYSEETYDEAQAGRDFWFTRCGHGAGYWGREQLCSDVGDGLSDIARAWGNVDIYMGDDGQVYC